ncbi:MAG: ASKHA domain-containing protein [Chloroflexota bacterium]
MGADGAKKEYLVVFQPSGRQGYVPEGKNLLDAAREMGVEIESICGGQQTCGKCKVLADYGDFQKYGIVSRPGHISPPGGDEQHYWRKRRRDPGEYRLSCAACVQGDLVIDVPEESQARKQIVRKSATVREIEIDPAIRQYFVKVKPAELGDRRGDWERLQDSLRETHQLEDLRIDYFALRDLQKTLRRGKWEVTVTIWNEHEVIRLQPGYEEGTYGFAVDVGTTTVAGHLVNLRTGEILATESMMNPQTTYGEDLMSRISYGMMNPDGVDKMHKAIIEALSRLVRRAARSAKLQPEDVTELVLVGNTVMIDLLLGIDPVELGGAPFALATHEAMDYKARDLGIEAHSGANVHILPAEAGHVGADNMGVVVAESPHVQEDIVLIVDIGTNAEILVGNKEHLLSASSPTGPAFEGGEISHGMRAAPGAIEQVRIDRETMAPRFKVIGDPRWSDERPAEEIQAAGICGSGIIDLIAELFAAGVIDSTGKFLPDTPSPNFRATGKVGEFVVATASQTSTGKEITVNQQDIRAIQFAKSALYTGAKLLMERRGITKVDRVLLAGGFGAHIDKRRAMMLGLVPDCDLDQVYAVGNSAGDGAVLCLLSRERRRRARQIARWIDYVETAVEPNFQARFVEALGLPHNKDEFPHLKGLIPDRAEIEAMQDRQRESQRQTRRARRRLTVEN